MQVLFTSSSFVIFHTLLVRLLQRNQLLYTVLICLFVPRPLFRKDNLLGSITETMDDERSLKVGSCKSLISMLIM